jgi:Domain of Unknown Function (DUF1080)
MKSLLALFLTASVVSAFAASIPLADGKTFRGWTGDTNKTWRIVDGAFVGGTLTAQVPRNEFLRTQQSYTNFVLTLKFKLAGTNGFVNGGVQIRSQPATKPTNEMVGYQCDIGPGWWGALYDESRRNKVLIKPDAEDVKKTIRLNDWNEYVIEARGKTIETSINGVKMIRYTEPDDTLPQHGLIGLQVHGGGVTEVSYKDLAIQVLP